MTLPGSIRADFSCSLIHQALTPSPSECEYFYTKTVGGIVHEFCGNMDLSTRKDVKGGSWSKDNLPPCYQCDKFTQKLSQ